MCKKIQSDALKQWKVSMGELDGRVMRRMTAALNMR